MEHELGVLAWRWLFLPYLVPSVTTGAVTSLMKRAIISALSTETPKHRITDSREVGVGQDHAAEGGSAHAAGLVAESHHPIAERARRTAMASMLGPRASIRSETWWEEFGSLNKHAEAMIPLSDLLRPRR